MYAYTVAGIYLAYKTPQGCALLPGDFLCANGLAPSGRGVDTTGRSSRPKIDRN